MIDFGPDTFGWTGAVGGIEPLLQACGDYIDGHYPATLEGAVRSGLQAAALIGKF